MKKSGQRPLLFMVLYRGSNLRQTDDAGSTDSRCESEPRSAATPARRVSGAAANWLACSKIAPSLFTVCALLFHVRAASKEGHSILVAIREVRPELQNEYGLSQRARLIQLISARTRGVGIVAGGGPLLVHTPCLKKTSQRRRLAVFRTTSRVRQGTPFHPVCFRARAGRCGVGSGRIAR